MRNLRFTLTFFYLAMVGCGGQMGTPEDELFRSVLNLESVTYSVLESQILRPFCQGCHDWDSSESGVLTQVVPGNPEASPLYYMVMDGSMPKNRAPLSSPQKELIRQYILSVSRGSQSTNPEPTPTPLPNPTPTPSGPPELAPTYSSLQYHLYEKSCLECHGPQGHPDTSIKLQTYEQASRRAKRSLTAMTDPSAEFPMPPLEKPRLAPEVIEAFREWIRLGMPQ